MFNITLKLRFSYLFSAIKKEVCSNMNFCNEVSFCFFFLARIDLFSFLFFSVNIYNIIIDDILKKKG